MVLTWDSEQCVTMWNKIRFNFCLPLNIYSVMLLPRLRHVPRFLWFHDLVLKIYLDLAILVHNIVSAIQFWDLANIYSMGYIHIQLKSLFSKFMRNFLFVWAGNWSAISRPSLFVLIISAVLLYRNHLQSNVLFLLFICKLFA